MQNTKMRLQNAKGAFNILPCTFIFFLQKSIGGVVALHL
jgi:hypothetical protein